MMNKQEIENFGLILEKYGFAPVPARVYALLMLTEPHEFHFDEIQGALQISKGATSNALKFLSYTGRLVQQTRPGNRKRYYCLGRLPGIESLAPFKAYIQTLKNYAEIALSSKATEDAYTGKFRASIRFCDRFLKMLSLMEDEDEDEET